MIRRVLFLIFIVISGFYSNSRAENINSQKERSNNETGQNNPYEISQEDVEWMRNATIKQLKGCRVKGADDVWIHTPDGVGNYKALWTRDSYYMVEYAGDLMEPDEIKASIHYLLNGQREDGCIPDRVNKEGKPIYSPGAPGKPMADHALDNGPFMAMMVCSYVNQYNDDELFREVESKLRKGLDHILLKESGLVYNDPKNPQCVYGFTDIVKKTGNLLFSSLLYYKACVDMEQLCKKYECGDPLVYKRRAAYINQTINKLWDEESGMFWAADKDCKQIDIWGSAYAVDVGITSEDQTEKIVNYFVNSYDQIIMRGQVRHLPGEDSKWDQLFHSCEEGTYQNGAYWATPLAWIIPMYAKRNPKLAQEMLQTVIHDFQKNGINECINEEYVKVPNFVVSATNVYSLTK
jgi:glycogen debranching enzyme